MTLLASDLDGTLIPPRSSDRRLGEIARLSEVVSQSGIRVAYVTGRHLALALEGMDTFRLPEPEAIACDVGTTVYWREGEAYALDTEYRRRIEASSGFAGSDAIRSALGPVRHLRLQPESQQSPFKVSYDVVGGAPADLAETISDVLEEVGRVRLVHSRDPWTGQGLLDVLPASVGKLSAVEHIARTLGLDPLETIYAGDSGNDRDAMLSGMRSIVVANAGEDLVAGLEDGGRVYFASRGFAMGVLEGLEHFRVAPGKRAP